jgi:hypothetical protein
MGISVVQKAHGIISANGGISFPSTTQSGNVVLWILAWGFYVDGFFPTSDDAGNNVTQLSPRGYNGGTTVDFPTTVGSESWFGIIGNPNDNSNFCLPMKTLNFVSNSGRTNPVSVWMFELSGMQQHTLTSLFDAQYFTQQDVHFVGANDLNGFAQNPMFSPAGTAYGGTADPFSETINPSESTREYFIAAVIAPTTQGGGVANITSVGAPFTLEAVQQGYGCAWKISSSGFDPVADRAVFTNSGAAFYSSSWVALSSPATGTITVSKHTNPGGSSQSFSFNPSWKGLFSLTTGQSDVSTVAAGTYSIFEAPVAGWTSSVVVSNGNPPTAIVVGAGDAVTVDFTNTQVATPSATCVTITGLNGRACSSTGNFAGPNVGSLALDINSGGNVWSNPTGVLGLTTFASAITGQALNLLSIPTTATNAGGSWVNPTNIFATGATVATAVGGLLIGGINFNLPSDAIVSGVKLSVSAKSTAPAGAASLSFQLASSGVPVGTAVSVPVGPTMAPYVMGSSSYQWGTALTPLLVNGAPFNVLVTEHNTAGTGTTTANAFTVQVFYTTTSNSEALQVTEFSFSIPPTAGVTGFGISFQAFSSAATTVHFQLLKNGVPVGTVHSQALSPGVFVYSLGNAGDAWGGSPWSFADVNNTKFGVQIISSGAGTTFINDLDMLVYLTPVQSNFNYFKSYVQDNEQIDTIALDSAGILWKEDVTNSPNILQIVLTGIIPGSFAKSATADDREYILFSDLTIGTDRPRVYDGSVFTPLSQVGPGAAPSFSPATGASGATTLDITSYSITGNEVTFTFVAGPTVSAGQIYAISGASPSFLNITGVVLGTPAPTGTTLVMQLIHANTSGSLSPDAVGTLQFNYPIASITQNPQKATNGSNNGGIFWGAGPGPTHTPGTNLVVYYSETQDQVLSSFFAKHPTSTYVYLSGINNFPQFSNKTYLVTAMGVAFPSSTAGASRFYFVVNVGVQGSSYPNGTVGFYQMTAATLTSQSAIPGLSTGDTIQITGETPIAWNNSWIISSALKSATLGVTSTQMSTGGVATYTYTVPVGGVSPVNGQIVSVTGCNNSAAGYTTSPFNTIGVIVVPGTLGAGSFDITGFTSGLPVPNSFENGIAETSGTQWIIDPGQLTLGTNQNPIYGNAGPSSGSTGIFIVGGVSNLITPGTRQGVVFFITETGYETQPSPPVVFTIPNNTSSILVSNIPIGPPNVVARGIALTEAGQNGIPGANFYVIPDNVLVQVQNSAPILYTSTIIKDNTSTTAKLTFTDAVLLNSTEIDVQGNDLFNLIELGSSAWCVPYASRMFYGLQLNKVDNFLNLTFDGGYLPTSTGTALLPLGWQVASGTSDIALLVSSVTGNSLYINNETGVNITNAGLIFQPAYVDVYNVPIINLNTKYSVRVAARAPSGLTSGTLVLSLSSYNSLGTTPASQFTPVYGTFSVPLSVMSTNVQVFEGSILSKVFAGTGGVPTDLVLSIQMQNLGPGADCEIDRIEVYPTAQPFLTAQVYGSYVNNLEAIDASGTGGIIDTSSENSQACFGGFVMHDEMYLLKTNSMYSTQDTTTSEPGGWGIHEVSNKVGTIGIHAYDVGEEWVVTACRAGIYGFNGGQPVKIMQELWNLWEKLNWNAGHTIVLRNDIVNRRILCAVPLPTPNEWLPYDPPNPAPTSPNVILMCNYQGLDTFEQLMSSPGVHTSMFGTLVAPDMKRKWSIWRIPTPYMDFVTRQNGIDKPLFVGNGINTSKIYQFLDDQLSDDGVAIFGLYTTYGHVNASKAATLPIFGFHTKRYTVFQTTVHGGGSLQIRILPNIIDPKYPYVLPTVALSDNMYDDFFRPINIKAQRAFLEFSTNSVGAWFHLDKTLLSGRSDPWSNLNPTGGGNTGITSTQ